jgi:LAGLIDADG endonuclease
VGFFEGDGNFQIHYKHSNVLDKEKLNNNKSFDLKEKNNLISANTRLGYSINISLSLIDLELLQNIKKKLNDYGTIYTYPNRKEARLAIFKKDEVKWLIENIFDIYPLITTHQKERYLKLRGGIMNNITLLKNLQENEKNFVNTFDCLEDIILLKPQYLDN